MDSNPGKEPVAPALQPGEGSPIAADDKPALFHHSLAARIRNYFLTGLVVDGPALHHDLVDLVVYEVGRRCGAAVHSGGLSAGNLSAGLDPGLGLIIAFVALTLLGFLTANLVGRTLVEFGETFSTGCRSCGRSTAA